MSTRRVGAAVTVVILAAAGWFGWQWWRHHETEPDLSAQPGAVERVPLGNLLADGNYDLREAEFGSFQGPDRFTFSFRARLEDDGSTYLVTDTHTGIIADDTVIVEESAPDTPLDAATALDRLPAGRRIYVGVPKTQLGEPLVNVYRIVITPEQVN